MRYYAVPRTAALVLGAAYAWYLRRRAVARAAEPRFGVPDGEPAWGPMLRGSVMGLAAAPYPTSPPAGGTACGSSRRWRSSAPPCG